MPCKDLATVAPDGLQRQITPDWFDRYSHRLEDYRLPSTQADRQQLAVTIGQDGFALLTAVAAPTAPVGSGSALPSTCYAGSGGSSMTPQRPRSAGAPRRFAPACPAHLLPLRC